MMRKKTVPLRVSLQPIGKMDGFALEMAKLEKVVENALDETALAIQVDYQVTTRTWQHKPVFRIERKGPFERWIYTEDEIYGYVSEGTSVRYATMTPDFQAKSAPMLIASRTGKGGVAFVNKSRPKPGIKAREFPEAIGRKWDSEWARQLERALASELFA